MISRIRTGSMRPWGLDGFSAPTVPTDDLEMTSLYILLLMFESLDVVVVFIPSEFAFHVALSFSFFVFFGVLTS